MGSYEALRSYLPFLSPAVFGRLGRVFPACVEPRAPLSGSVLPGRFVSATFLLLSTPYSVMRGYRPKQNGSSHKRHERGGQTAVSPDI